MRAQILLFGAILLTPACGGSTGSGTSSGGTSSGGTSSGGTSSGGTSSGGTSSGGTSSGGSSATGGTGAVGGSAGSGGSPTDGGDCAALLDTYQKALADAVVCSPQLSVVQCSGTATVPDTCGCPVVLNETQPTKVQAAQAAYDAWTQAGCGPYGCGAPCFAGTAGICDPSTGICQWATN